LGEILLIINLLRGNALRGTSLHGKHPFASCGVEVRPLEGV